MITDIEVKQLIKELDNVLNTAKENKQTLFVYTDIKQIVEHYKLLWKL